MGMMEKDYSKIVLESHDAIKNMKQNEKNITSSTAQTNTDISINDKENMFNMSTTDASETTNPQATSSSSKAVSFNKSIRNRKVGPVQRHSSYRNVNDIKNAHSDLESQRYEENESDTTINSASSTPLASLSNDEVEENLSPKSRSKKKL